MPVNSAGVWVAPERMRSSGGFSRPMKHHGQDVWFAGEITAYVERWLHQVNLTEASAMDIEDHALAATKAANEALAELKAGLDKFRSAIVNDLTSIKAAGTRVQNEVHQMKQAYASASAALCAPEFERAVVNAERMATALRAISELSETKLSVAVFNGGKS